jgi:hypothetical protein
MVSSGNGGLGSEWAGVRGNLVQDACDMVAHAAIADRADRMALVAAFVAVLDEAAHKEAWGQYRGTLSSPAWYARKRVKPVKGWRHAMRHGCGW